MNLRLLPVAWLAGCVLCAAAAPAPLFELSIDDTPPGGGKPLRMTVSEVERAATHSIVELRLQSGSSVASSLFAVRALCGLMRARGEHAFATESIDASPERLRVTFPASPTPQQTEGPGHPVFTLAQCQTLGY